MTRKSAYTTAAQLDLAKSLACYISGDDLELNINDFRRTVADRIYEDLGRVDFIKSFQDALGTAETGEALVEVARNAHRAEQELAAIRKHEQEQDWGGCDATD